MTDARTIDGIAPARWERPDHPEEIADLLKATAAAGGWVLPVGGGTAMAAPSPVDAIPVALDLTGIAGVREYEPTDLTISVAAGTRWHDLQATLREHGQEIPIDVAFPDVATVGGVVATGYAGPRRLRDGTLKDLLLGSGSVRGDGLVAKAGGMVVKNVSGFEIPRLLHGSWGSLAVITSVNLKVIPRPEFELTLTTEPLDLVEAVERALDLTRRKTAVAAAVVDGTSERATVAVRLTGREGPTRDLAVEIRELASLPWIDPVTEGEASTDWWQNRENRLAADQPDRVAIDVGCQPSDIAGVLRALLGAVPAAAAPELYVSPGIGAVGVTLDAGTLSHEAWTRLLAEHDLNRTTRYAIRSAPREWRAARDVWAIPPDQRHLMTALKRTFDPDDTLNRGRLWTAPLVPQT